MESKEEKQSEIKRFVQVKRRRPGIRELIVSFLCPLSKMVMEDPVIAMDGYTYERRAIEAYIRANSVSPVTGLPMQRLLVPNRNLKAQMVKYYPDAPKRRQLSYFRVISIITIVNVFSHLNVKELARCASVCHEWEEVNDLTK